MYYHCRPIKFVIYGKVEPPPPSERDEFFDGPYKWLGHYCGFFPQIWLSRSRKSITGIRNNKRLKKRQNMKMDGGWRKDIKTSNDSVLFGFEPIKGFPLSYDHWEYIMNPLFNVKGNLQIQNKAITEFFDSMLEDYEADNLLYGYNDPDPVENDWEKSGCNLEVYLRDYVFKEVDQVVVPTLNLKSAKKIFCHNEKQKKKLRKMGFIEDRIHIQNFRKVSSF